MTQKMSLKSIVLMVLYFFGLCINVEAQPVYVHDYLLQGETIGTVVDIEPSVNVLSETTVVDVREWLPSLQEPVLAAATTYQLSVPASERLSLFSLNSTREPIVLLDEERLSPLIAQYPLSKIFYENSFREANTKDTPLGALLKKENLVGYAIPQQTIEAGQHVLKVGQRFDVRTDSTHFTRRYSLFLLNPQWQGQLTGLLRAWEVRVEVLVPPSWKVRSPQIFERSNDVVTFQLDPSQAVLEVELIPPHSKQLYKLVKSSLWLLLMIMSVITGFIAYAGATFVDRTRIPPRVMMLLIVLLCMGIDLVLAKQLSNHLQTEAFLNHLSLLTLHEIQDSHWVHQFYGAILTGLIACFVFLRTLDIPFFEPVEIEEGEDTSGEESGDAEAPPDETGAEETTVEEGIQPPEFTLMGGDGEEASEESPQEFFVMTASDEDNK